MSQAAADHPLFLPHEEPGTFNPWVIALTVTLGTFMEVLDTSIANVSLPHIAGSLASTQEESTWVLTSYLVSNAIVLPISGWFSAVLGRKRFNMTCVLIFTISSALCGMAPTLGSLIFFRILQGVGGGGLQPSVQAILLDAFPASKRGMAMAVYTIAILVAPVLGPTLGGWITDSYSWRWIFYINVPVGLVALVLTQIVLHDPAYLLRQRKELLSKPIRVDLIGLGLIALGLGALQIMLDKGQEEDWFASNLILTLAITATVGLTAAVIWELHHAAPVVNMRLFKDRNFSLCCLVTFSAFATLYATTVLLPQMLQTLMGYSATEAGLVLSPAALVAMIQMPILGLLLSRGFDARRLIILGLLVTTASAYWMSKLNLEVAPGDVIWPRIVQVLGGSMMFVPINTIVFRGIPRSQSGNAAGLFALVRNEGASIGVAAVTTLLQRHTQLHQSYLIERISPLNPLAASAMNHISAFLSPLTTNPNIAALGLIYHQLQRQAAALAYLDLFRLFTVVTIGVIPLVLCMRRGGSVTAAELAGH